MVNVMPLPIHAPASPTGAWIDNYIAIRYSVIQDTTWISNNAWDQGLVLVVLKILQHRSLQGREQAEFSLKC